MLWWCPLVFAGDGDPVYLEALAAWERRDWDAALARAEVAVGLEPSHRPAQLLEGYALLRLHRGAEAIEVLSALAALPVDDDYERVIQRRADRVRLRWTDRARRDQVAVAAGFAVPFERRNDQLLPLSGFAGTVEVPLPAPVEVRAEALLPLGDDGLFDVTGPYLGVQAVAHLPLGRGVWSADAALGPELWLARGGYWEDGTEPYVGLRAAVGVDLRASRDVGVRLQAGTRWLPAAHEVLPWYGVPLDATLSVITWWGR